MFCKTIILNSQNVNSNAPKGILTLSNQNNTTIGKIRLYNIISLPQDTKIGLYINDQVHISNLIKRPNHYEFDLEKNVNLNQSIYCALIDNSKGDKRVILEGGSFNGFYFTDSPFDAVLESKDEELEKTIDKAMEQSALCPCENNCAECEYKKYFYDTYDKKSIETNSNENINSNIETNQDNCNKDNCLGMVENNFSPNNLDANPSLQSDSIDSINIQESLNKDEIDATDTNQNNQQLASLNNNQQELVKSSTNDMDLRSNTNENEISINNENIATPLEEAESIDLNTNALEPNNDSCLKIKQELEINDDNKDIANNVEINVDTNNKIEENYILTQVSNDIKNQVKNLNENDVNTQINKTSNVNENADLSNNIDENNNLEENCNLTPENSQKEDNCNLDKNVSSKNELNEEQNQFLNDIIYQLDEMFAKYPADDVLNSIIPDSRFIKVENDNSNSYVLGVIYENKLMKYIAYGVPAKYNTLPPADLGQNYQWLPLNPEDVMSDGYYLIYQNALNGKIVELTIE